MEITVNVNIELSDATKQFLSGLFSYTAKQQIEAVPQFETKLAKQPKPIEKPVVQQPVQQSLFDKPVEQPKNEERKPVDTIKPVEESSITLNDVRKVLAEKVNEHRQEIKDKLTELGAPSCTKLDVSKYQEMYDFLNSL